MPIASRPAGTGDRAAAEGVAATAVHYLALEIERLQRFLDLTGTTPDALRERLAATAFLAGVLEHLLADERLLLDFAAWAELPPTAVAEARSALSGGRDDHDG